MVEYQILVPPNRRRRNVLLVSIVTVALVAVGGGAYAITRHMGSSANRGTPGGITAATKPTPLQVLSTEPAAGATNVPTNQVVSVRFSAPISNPGAALSFQPPVSGTWRATSPTTLSFVATQPFTPTVSETLRITAGSTGPRGTDGRVLAAPVAVSFTVAQATTERLQQLLAQLGYLPLTFSPSAPEASALDTFAQQTGTFHWRWSGLPSSLTSLWTEGYEDVITKAAVMNFENQNGLAVDGLAGKEVWSTLLADIGSRKVNAVPYVYVYVTKQLPESLTLYEDGVPKFVGIPVNTGAPGADTADGTYPVFEHVVSSRMQGTNPDGTKYDDPAVPWASYFNGGDALHGFVRATYGSPQSNGCVEMSIADAAQVWPLTPIGTLVTVVGPAS
jgi:peptidoglycan hydrolase-like protein with peptidoglycan-binding domain